MMENPQDKLPDSKKPPGEVTELLVKWSEGDTNALDELIPIIYGELRHIADKYMRREYSSHTLQTTALVHEAYIRLVETQGLKWNNREQFFGISANLMRQILVDHARTANASKRGGKVPNLPLDEALKLSSDADKDLLLLDEALNKLAAIDAEAARIVELRYFAGLTIDETVAVLKTSPMTVKREWATARAWLHREIAGT